MTKEEILEELEKSKEYHLHLTIKVNQLISGKTVHDLESLTQNQCEFGQWMRGDLELKKSILGSLFYKKLDVIHAKWHKEFMQICELFEEEQHKGFLSKLFHSKIEPMKLDKAKVYFLELESTTQDLVHALETSYRRVSALNESKFH